jgi:hypothetical protein
VKSPSALRDTLYNKSNTKGSLQYLSTTTSESNTFHVVFDIFAPFRFKNPCANNVLGNGNLADNNIAGQNAAWNLRISFPIT